MRKDGWMAMACVVATCNRWVCILHDQQKKPKKTKKAEESKAFISNFTKKFSKGGFDSPFDLVQFVHAVPLVIAMYHILLAFLVLFLVYSPKYYQDPSLC